MFHVIPGARLGPYQLVSSLGAGGMGEVFKATDTRLDRAVAIKVLPSHLASDADAKARFGREAKAIAALNHPNICTLHDIGHHDGTDFLVMELVEGETLATRLERGALPLGQVLKIATEMAEALDKAHRAGIVHRDLKPANIMLTKSGAKLLDFGLAKLAPQQPAITGFSNAATQTPVTGAGTILGSLNYMSPEQVEGKEADHRSDIFSFGCVLYEMVTGKRAFDGASAASVMAAILERVPVITAGESLPEGIEWIVRRCLRKAPDERCQSARDLADELQWVGSSPRAAASVGSRTSSRAALIGAVCAALLTAVAGVVFVATRQGASQPPVTTVAFQVHAPEGTYLPEAAPNAVLAVAPDESAVAFSIASIGGTAIAVRSLSGFSSVVLSGTERGDGAFWSPDGQFIAFIADGELRKVSVQGGRPVTLATGAIGGGTWNAQGDIIFAGPRGLMRTTASGGAVMPVTHIEHEGDRHMYPQFLSDGQSFIFLELRASGGGITFVSTSQKRVLVESRSRGTVAGGTLLFVQRIAPCAVVR